MDTDRTNHEHVTRRSALQRGAGLGALILGGSSLVGLGGCESASQKRIKKRGGQIGAPIATDPVHSSKARPSPITHHPVIQPTMPITGSLDTVPGFVVARTQWTKAKPKRWLADPMKKVTRITVHHDAINQFPTGSFTNSARRLTAIRNGHIGRGWADIGYHYAVDPSGRVWQARPLTLQGAHVKNQNPNNLGIVVFGNYEKSHPTARALDSLNKLLAHEMQRFRVPLGRVYTHRELASTACPGRNLQAKMIRIRRSDGALAMLLRDSDLA